MRAVRARISWGAVAGLLLLAGALPGCGGGGDDNKAASTQRTAPLAAEERFVNPDRVTPAQIRKAPPGSVQRAFLQYWSALDYEDWRTAIAFFSPTLRSASDARYLPETLRGEAQNNHPIK